MLQIATENQNHTLLTPDETMQNLKFKKIFLHFEFLIDNFELER
jgi:hypothetical protein